MEFLRNHKDVASLEVLPNHLTLRAPECYEKLGTLAQQNPPIRQKHHQDALWKAVNDGISLELKVYSLNSFPTLGGTF